MASYLLKAPPAQIERWKAAAEAAGYSLAEWLRAAADAQVGEPGAAKSKPKKKSGRGARTEMCEHRVPPTAHCGRCD